jgi:hypothetical protein
MRLQRFVTIRIPLLFLFSINMLNFVLIVVLCIYIVCSVSIVFGVLCAVCLIVVQLSPCKTP